MVIMHFPSQLTEEEENLLKKYAKFKKKKKALAMLRTQKTEPPPTTNDPTKRSSEEAANATEQAKKLLKLGAIKVGVEKKEMTGFKRSKRQKDNDKTTVTFTPFAATHNEGEEEKMEEGEEDKIMSPEKLERSEKPERGEKSDRVDRNERADRGDRGTRGGRGRFRGGLYDNFVTPKSDRRERREFENERDPPRRGHTIYVFGHGVTEDIISKSFSNIGTIINISMEPEKNCAFVSFEKTESADEAIAQMSGSMVSGIQLKVSMARRQPTFETNTADPSGSSWSSIAASHSQKGAHKDKRELVTYDADDIF